MLNNDILLETRILETDKNRFQSDFQNFRLLYFPFIGNHKNNVNLKRLFSHINDTLHKDCFQLWLVLLKCSS